MKFDDESLLDRYQTLLNEGKLPEERKTEGLPLINEDTRDTLISLYGITDKPEVPRYIPRYFDDEVQGGPYAEGLKIAEDVLCQVAPEDKSGYLYHLGLWLNNSFKDSYEFKKPDLQDSAIVGVGAVVKAFEVQVGYSVLEGLGEVDNGLISSAFEEEPLKSRTSLINRMLSNKQFPQYQTSLGSFISELSTYSSNPEALKDGASMQYHVFESLWSQISRRRK